MQDPRPADGFEPFRPPELRIKKGRGQTPDRTGIASSHDRGNGEPTLDITSQSQPPKEPNIQVIREEGLIRKIKVECTCGETLELNCVYDAPSPDSPRLHRADGSEKARPSKDAKSNGTPAPAPTPAESSEDTETTP